MFEWTKIHFSLCRSLPFSIFVYFVTFFCCWLLPFFVIRDSISYIHIFFQHGQSFMLTMETSIYYLVCHNTYPKMYTHTYTTCNVLWVSNERMGDCMCILNDLVFIRVTSKHEMQLFIYICLALFLLLLLLCNQETLSCCLKNWKNRGRTNKSKHWVWQFVFPIHKF